ncbi:hypothetical protein C4564_03760 [Candidatus Microgenomates bacterium]|nr:MAG: hypothetical protein C4564_03760 [Candidatus Microgenomates bacterium]
MMLSKKGLVQAFSVSLYCSTIGLFFFKANEIFGKTPNYFGPVAFLLLLSVSVLVCGLLVFYKPYKLFFVKKRTEAIDLVVSTTVWLFVFLTVFLLLALVIK